MVAHVQRKRNFELRYAFWAQMVPAQIDKEVLIEAPIDIVWRVVTEPDQIKQWFCPDTELDERTGIGRMAFDRGHTYFLEVVAFEPPSRFAYRWLRQEAVKARPENSTLVEFTLRAEAGNTRLHVVESGFDKVDWTDEAKAKYFEENLGGWQFYLGRLRDYAPRVDTAAHQ
ncbi:MAG TPA: SRPBCC domain-containing protein [Candidatus Dormibacteraeota bacterium]